LLLVAAYIGFVSLGLPDTLIGVAWPSIRGTFGVAQGAVAVVFFATGASYFASSFFTGRLLAALGIGRLLAGSTALVALGLGGFALAPVWPAFAACAVLHGLGSGAIDAGLNYYAAHHLTARHMNWLHACYSLGATLGPLLLTAVIVRGESFRVGYLIVSGVLGGLALFFAGTARRWGEVAGSSGTTWRLLRTPLAVLQTVFFFVYTGLEVTLGQLAFTLLTEGRHVPPATAGLMVGGYWGSLLAGRVLFGAVVERVGIDRLLRASTLLVVVGVVCLGANLTALGLILAGLGLAPIYPCTMTRTPERLGPELSAHAIGMQVAAAMVGAAVLPGAAALLAQHRGLEIVPGFALVLAAILVALHEALSRCHGPSPD
jgi:fucose permease